MCIRDSAHSLWNILFTIDFERRHAVTPSFLLQKCESCFWGETGTFCVAIIAPDSAKSESEVGMKKVSLDLRLFGEEGGAENGTQSAEGSSVQTTDCAAEQSEREKVHTDDSKRAETQIRHFAAPVGSKSGEEDCQSRGESGQKADEGENIVKVPASPRCV